MEIIAKLQIKPGPGPAWTRWPLPLRQVSIDRTWSALRFRPA